MYKFINVVILGIVLITAMPTFATVLFNGNFETADHSQWSDLSWNLDRPEAEQFEIVTDIVREGTYAARMTVHDGDEFLDTGGERVQLERPDAYNEEEGTEYWYSWSTFFPADWQNLTNAPDDWLLIADWHATNNADFSEICQPLQIELNGNNQLIATILSGNVTGYDCFNGSGTANYFDQVIVDGLDLGKWNDFVIHVKWTVEDTGVVEIWHKTDDEATFTKVLNQSGIPTRQYVNNKANSDTPYFILAHYRSEEQAHTSVLYQDAFRQATSLYDLDENNGVWWQPHANERLTWQWDLSDGTVDTSYDVDMYDVDLFDTSQAQIDELHTAGRKVVCYFSAGSWEDWRDDAGSFAEAVKGNDLDGWAGEKWLDIRAASLRLIMQDRLDLAATKQCDGVEPDNIDGYTNDTGFPLTAGDQLTYNNWLVTEAHNRNLSIGLKNDVDQINDLVGSFDWALNEQCYQYDECIDYQSFITNNKPVFGVEYNLEPSAFCPQANASGYSWLKKNLNLDSWRFGCEGYETDTTPPTISEVSPVPSPTGDSTPNYTFITNEAGTITYGGSCSSVETVATTGDNTVTFNTLADGIYSDCTITVTDSSTNISNLINIGSFTIDTTIQPSDLSGEWTLSANGIGFRVFFFQDGNDLTGYMIYDGAQRPESIYGSISGGQVTFFRNNSQLAIPQQYVTTYMSDNSLEGNFSHNNQWGYSWEATRVATAGYVEDISGSWQGLINSYESTLNLSINNNILEGVVGLSAFNATDNIKGIINGNNFTFFRSNSQLAVPQEFRGSFDGGTSLSGSFSHNGVWGGYAFSFEKQ